MHAEFQRIMDPLSYDGDEDLDGAGCKRNATTTLSNSRDQMVATLKSLTNFAQAQDQLVFDPYLNQFDRQVKEADAILDEITKGRAEVGTLVDWIDRFIYQVPKGVPADFAQVYSWFVNCPQDGC